MQTEHLVMILGVFKLGIWLLFIREMINIIFFYLANTGRKK